VEGSGPVAILAQHFSGETEEIREKNYYNANARQCYDLNYLTAELHVEFQ